MKKLLLAALFVSFSASAQFNDFKFKESEDFGFALFVDPFASEKEGGLLIGAEIEYSGLVYVRPSISHFSALKDGYTDLLAGIGVNMTSGTFEEMRYYAGVRLGFIKRQDTYPLVGAEAGVNWNFSNNYYLGARLAYDYRCDQEFYDSNNRMVGSGFAVIGIKF